MTKIEVSDTYLIVKEGSHTYRAFKEPSANLYQLFHDAGVSLDKTSIVVTDTTGTALLINFLASVLPVVGIVVAMVFMGVFYVTIIYIIYLVIRALRKYLSS